MTPTFGLTVLLGALVTLVIAVAFIVDGIRQQAQGKRAAGAILIGGGLVLVLVFMVMR